MASIISTNKKQKYNKEEGYWQNELNSLGIEPKRRNEFNDKEELQGLAEIIKQIYYQEYKAAYSGKEEDKSRFKYLCDAMARYST